MSFDMVFVFPLLAVFVALYFPLKSKRSISIRTLRSSRVRSVFLARIVVVVLPLAALFSMVFSPLGQSNAVEAGLLSAVIVLPAIVIHLLFQFRARWRRHRQP